MNKLVYSAIALTAVSASALATDNGWVSLDQEINNLNASLSSQNATGPKVGGYARVRWTNSSDIQVTDPISGNPHDLSGFSLDNVRVEITGDAGSDYSYKVSFDLAGGTAALKDAYAKFKISENVWGKIGNFKANFLRTEIVADNKLILLDRTVLGNIGAWNTRDLGIELGVTYDMLTVTVSGQNGTDGLGKEYEWYAKAVVNLMGGGVGKVEGAYGAGDQTALTAGISYMDDSNLTSASALGFEAELTAGPFSLSGELVDFGTNGVVTDSSVVGTPVYGFGNTTPWDVTGSYLFTDQWEVAGRYEDLDDTNNDKVSSFGVNYYVSGHDIKWTAEYQKLATDAASGDVSKVMVGFSIAL